VISFYHGMPAEHETPRSSLIPYTRTYEAPSIYRQGLDTVKPKLGMYPSPFSMRRNIII